jgi:hypothetical protein
MQTSILVSVGAVGVLVAAVVLASPMSTETAGTPAVAPNRAEVHVVATCGAGAAAPDSWHDALGTRRAAERDLVLVSATGDVAEVCDPAGR